MARIPSAKSLGTATVGGMIGYGISAFANPLLAAHGLHTIPEVVATAAAAFGSEKATEAWRTFSDNRDAQRRSSLAAKKSTALYEALNRLHAERPNDNAVFTTLNRLKARQYDWYQGLVTVAQMEKILRDINDDYLVLIGEVQKKKRSS